MVLLLIALCLEVTQAPAPPQAPSAQVCGCLDGLPCVCADCPCAWDRYVQLRAQAIRENRPLVVSAGQACPTAVADAPAWLACTMPGPFADSNHRIVVAVPHGGDLWIVGTGPPTVDVAQIHAAIGAGRAALTRTPASGTPPPVPSQRERGPWPVLGQPFQTGQYINHFSEPLGTVSNPRALPSRNVVCRH